jgi:hypothetical protein
MLVNGVNDNERAARDARRQTAMQTMALVVLLERNGGSLRVTEAEYRDVVDRYGGSARMAIHLEVLGTPAGHADEIDVRLIRKDSAAGELIT